MTADPTTSSPGPSGPDFKALYRKLEVTLDRIERTEDVSRLLSIVLKSLVRNLKDDLGFVGGRLYERDGDDFVLKVRYGRAIEAKPGYRVPAGYTAMRRVLEEGLIIMREGDPGFDERIEGAVGVSKFAAIAVGEEKHHILSFTIKGKIQREHILYSLNAVRHVINLRLRQQQFTDIMIEARTIQESLLPAAPPAFEGFDIDGRSRPTEVVGGDLFDYLALSPHLLGVAIADASGHGLPAALLARDVITGLRMGMAEDLKIIKAVERLNRVIHRSALSSKFVSLFYGEVEPNGNFLYCNAGHNPPLLRKPGSFRELTQGGLVLGPNPEARYERGYVQMTSGSMVVMYTDGVTERENPAGKQFGLPRLRNIIRRADLASAREVVDTIFAATDEFAAGAHQRDDMTVVVVRKV
ncbi:MAG: PP2C family protein-serine/threonine phosphatase [Acidobacteria bacterium]|nr:PP2C family protein-serine/threonine phosphatase [Acidobacteriota bacterium]